MKRTLPTLTLLIPTVAVLLAASSLEVYAQRRESVTTEPTHKKGDPCEDKAESSVTKTPWKITKLGFLRSTNTPVDTTQISTAAEWLSDAVDGNLENYEAIVDTLKGSTTEGSYVLYARESRYVTVTSREWKCIDGVLKLVKDETRTYTEESAWTDAGPILWSNMSVKKLKALIEEAMKKLPAE